MNPWFGRFARKEKIKFSTLLEAVERIEAGQIDVDYGGGLFKQRIARLNSGKSGGFRSIILYRKGERAFFVFGYPKSERENLEDDEVANFKKVAKYVLGLTNEELEALIQNGKFKELKRNDKKVSE